MVLADDFGAGQVFVDLLMFFLFVIWIWLLIVVFSDLFRSRDLSGWAKAAWVIFIVIIPYLGVLVYLIARGNKMTQHAQQAAAAQDAAAKAYIQQAAGTTPSTADEIQRLADLKAQGVISDEEFETAKAKTLAL
jgi:phosphoglycerol transferase MdoB-like AlkP superfamily enzyme